MDAVLDSAVDLARETAIEVAEGAEWVGEHLGTHEDEDRLVTHLFACTMPGYRGWVWSVTLSRAPRAREAKVCEAHLVPADDALLAPAWIPWADRVRPGDLEPSMVLPKIHEDARLMPGYEVTDPELEDAMEIWELGLGRERVLAPEGRDSAAARWHRGSHGPTAPSAVASAQQCSTCAFFIPLTGSLRTEFGACANEWSPSDGKVVAVDHGCGAHSQTDIEQQSTRWPANNPVFDTEGVVELPASVETPPDTSAAEVSADAEPEAQPESEAQAEPMTQAEAPAEQPTADDVADAPESVDEGAETPTPAAEDTADTADAETPAAEAPESQAPAADDATEAR